VRRSLLAVLPLCVAIFACGSDAGSTVSASGDDAAAPDASPAGDDAAADVASGSDADASETGAARQVLGYYTGEQASYDAITAFHGALTMVSADLYDVQPDGTIAGADGLNVLAHDRAYGLATFVSISNYSSAKGDFDAALGHAALVTHKDAVIAGALAIAAQGFQGINIDFEGIAYSANIADDRAAYTTFMHDLSAKAHSAGLVLVASVPRKAKDDPADTWAYPYDFAALGPDLDYLQLMTYDESGPGWSAPGPVSGLDWTESSAAYAASVVAPGKILLGLPAYGYDWDLTASKPAQSTYVGTSVAWKDIGALVATPGAAAHWDAATSSPYVDYTAADGHKHEAWYEDPQSVAAKAKLVGKYQLGGLSVWALGYEDAAFWGAAKGP
jgi:spore germination protein YaaH